MVSLESWILGMMNWKVILELFALGTRGGSGAFQVAMVLRR